MGPDKLWSLTFSNWQLFDRNFIQSAPLQNTKQPLMILSDLSNLIITTFQESAQHRQGQALDQARLEGGGRGRGEVPERDHGGGAQPDQALPCPEGRQEQLEWDQQRPLRVRRGKLLRIRANEKGGQSPLLFAFRMMLNKESSGKLILRWRDPDK